MIGKVVLNNVLHIIPNSAFKGLSTIGQCPVNINIPAPKIGDLQMGAKTQNADFLENNSD
jgi:hypothetical protein